MKHLLSKHNKTSLRTYDHEVVAVRSHLSLTPSEMLAMSERGIPIASNMNPDDFVDGDESPFVNINPLDCRGIDIVDAWNLQKASRKKLLSARDTDIQNYG